MEHRPVTIWIPKLGWPRIRFRLASLLALMTLVCVGAAMVLWLTPPDRELPGLVPIVGPVTSGTTTALDPPLDDEVIIALEQALADQPGFGGYRNIRQQSNIRIVKEKTADFMLAPQDYYMIGRAQPHHAHYRCTVYFNADAKGSKQYSYVLNVDHHHLHMLNAPAPDEVASTSN